MTLIPDTKDTTPQTLQNGYPAGSPAVNLNTLRCPPTPIHIPHSQTYTDTLPSSQNDNLNYQMQRPRTNLKTQSIQSSERHTCSGHKAQTNDYFTTNPTQVCEYR